MNSVVVRNFSLFICRILTLILSKAFLNCIHIDLFWLFAIVEIYFIQCIINFAWVFYIIILNYFSYWWQINCRKSYMIRKFQIWLDHFAEDISGIFFVIWEKMDIRFKKPWKILIKFCFRAKNRKIWLSFVKSKSNNKKLD